MGASYIEHTFIGTRSKKDVLEGMDILQDQAIHESGTSYSGDLGSAPSGVDFTDKLFNSENEASDWVCNNHSKWTRPIAVKYKVPDDKKVAKINEKLIALIRKKSKIKPWRTCTAVIGDQVVNRISTQSAKYKTCNDCGSKVSSQHIKPVLLGKCPVCDCPTAFFTNGDWTKLDSLKKKVDKINTEIDNVETEIKNLASLSNDTRWLVGCWCSS